MFEALCPQWPITGLKILDYRDDYIFDKNVVIDWDFKMRYQVLTNWQMTVK